LQMRGEPNPFTLKMLVPTRLLEGNRSTALIDLPNYQCPRQKLAPQHFSLSLNAA